MRKNWYFPEVESDESEDEDEDGVKPSTRRALSAAGIEPPKVRTPIAHFKACAMVARIIFQFKDQVPIDEDCAEEEEAEDQDNETGHHGTKYNKSFGKNLKTEDVHTVPEIFFDVQG